MRNRKATWSIRLETDCPKCNLSFDLMRDSNFKTNLRCAPLEIDSFWSMDIKVACHFCGYEFPVDFEY